MDLIKIILLALTQFVTGFGLFSILKITLRPWMAIALSILIGVGIAAFSLLCLVFFRVPFSFNIFMIVLIAAMLLTNIYSIKIKFENYRALFSMQLIRSIRLYELPAIIFLAFVFFVSAWRCYYLPSYARDLTSGPEVIAEYAVREHKVDNSLFSVNLESTNNQFKSPFIIVLQVLYKYAGFPFGQVWLSSVVLSFMLFLYQALARKIHAVFVGALLLWFMAIPEMFAYTFMLLYDYSNAVYFTIGLYFLWEYNEENTLNYSWLASIFFAIAIFVRSETLIFVGIFSIFYALVLLFKKQKFKTIFYKGTIIVLPSLLIYYVTGPLYLNHYLPQHYDIANQVNSSLSNLNPFFERLSGIYDHLLTGEYATAYYGNFSTMFMVLLFIDIALYIFDKKSVFRQEYNSKAFIWLAMLVLFILTLAFIGYLLPLADLDHTTKRAMFKFFPLLLLYFGYSISLRKISRVITY